METTNHYIYALLNNLKPGKFIYGDYIFDYEPYYIGVSNTETYYRREDVHIKYAKIKKDVCNNKLKMNIINKIIKNGFEPISVKILENMTKEYSYKMEIDIIKNIGTRISKKGPLSNISLGGDGGDTFTNNPNKEEIREKHRLNAIGSNNNMYGLPFDKRPSHIAKLNGNHWNKGRVASISTKKILSEQRVGSGNSRAKKTLLFDKDFNLVKEFDYCFAISDYLGSSNRAVVKTANTNSKKEIPYHTTKGYFIIYKYDWENKFKEKEDEIKEFIKTFKKNKNQFS